MPKTIWLLRSMYLSVWNIYIKNVPAKFQKRFEKYLNSYYVCSLDHMDGQKNGQTEYYPSGLQGWVMSQHDLR